ncbi:MAG: ECF transporter S component [Gemmiger sp.]|nr:ECF transporter S component [Gemmiger sp.]
MFTTTKTKNLVFTAVCAALCVVLPIAFHTIPNAGSVMLPMHIPVLLCGLACGPVYGLACGLVGPVLSSLLTGMPGAAYLPAMLCELAVYGLVSGLLLRVIKTGKPVLNLYISLLGAMLAGRVAYGVLNAVIFRAGQYSLPIWLTSAFVTSLPGIAIQLVILPALILALRRAKLLNLPG